MQRSAAVIRRALLLASSCQAKNQPDVSKRKPTASGESWDTLRLKRLDHQQNDDDEEGADRNLGTRAFGDEEPQSLKGELCATRLDPPFVWRTHGVVCLVCGRGSHTSQNAQCMRRQGQFPAIAGGRLYASLATEILIAA